MRLLPREEKFFGLFLDQVGIIVEAAELLFTGAKLGNAHLAEAAEKIVDLEQKGDGIIHDIFTKLNQTFITPIDPEDIHSISSRLDDVLDGIEDAAHRMVAYHVDPIPPRVVELCGIVRDCSLVLVKAFTALNDEQPLLDHCIEINRLEGLADHLVRDAISRLFQNEKDPISLIKLKEVYEFLEATTDYCEDVADVLQEVVVKNS